MNKELRAFLREIQREGYQVEQTPKKFKIRTPNNKLITTSCTPSCRHAVNQIKRDIRKYG